jgi:hypothetical protein
MMAITVHQALLAFDGWNVHLSADKLSTLVAQGDIGQNDVLEFLKFSFGKCCCSAISEYCDIWRVVLKL